MCGFNILLAHLNREAKHAFPEIDHLREKMGMKWTDALLRAGAEGAFLVDHMPLTSNTFPIEAITVPPPFGASVIGCHAIIKSLKDFGWISEEDYGTALEGMGGSQVADSPEISLPRGSKLFLLGNVISLLAEPELLTTVCDRYQVFVDPFYIQHVREIIKAGEYARDLRGWLGRLSDRVREGQTTGIYKCIEVADEHLANNKEREALPEVVTLRDLLVRQPRDGDVVWVDDRNVNSHSRSESAPVIGVNEVLAALRERGALTKKRYYEALQKMRAGNFRYVPLSARELLYYIDRARVNDGELIESPDLRILRRYIAACLLDTNALQVPPLPPGAPNMSGEIAFALSVKSAVEEAIIRVWTDKTSSEEVIEARANWLLYNMYTGTFGIRHLLPHSRTRGDAADLLGLDIGGLLAVGGVTLLDIPANKGKLEKWHRRRFIEWLEENLILSRLKADPEVTPVVADTIATFITDAASRKYKTLAERNFSRLSKNLLFTDLPQEIKKDVKLTPEVLKWIGVKLFEAVSIGPYDFNRVEFSNAVARVMSGTRRAKLSALSLNTVIISLTQQSLSGVLCSRTKGVRNEYPNLFAGGWHG
jgi:hypothetical protein